MGQNIRKRIIVFHVSHIYEWSFVHVVKSRAAKSAFHTLRDVDYPLNRHLWFQSIANCQIPGPKDQTDSLSYTTTSKAIIQQFRNCTYNKKSCAHKRTYTHTHMHIYTKPAIKVAGINITSFSCNKVTFYEVHTLYIIPSAPSSTNSAISQYCSRILSNEYNNWQYHPLWDKLFPLSLSALQYTPCSDSHWAGFKSGIRCQPLNYGFFASITRLVKLNAVLCLW